MPDWATALAAETAAIRGYGQLTTPRAGNNDRPHTANRGKQDAPDAAAAANEAPAGQQVLVHAARGLQLAQAVEATVRTAGSDVHDELWWLRLAEALTELAASLDLLAAEAGMHLGAGPTPPGPLPDTPALRAALHALLAAIHETLHRNLCCCPSRDGRRALAAAIACRAAADAAGRADS